MFPATDSLQGFQGVALIQDGADDLLAVARGATGREPDSGCTLETRFQIASVSKQFTATALLLLSDIGLVSMDDRVSRWLDDCPEAWRPITLHHLLTHTAGLVHWPQIPELDLCRQISVEELLRIFEEAPLLSQPGERYFYSSPGYVIAAHVVENASGKTYSSYLKEAIFEPLGMHSTFAGNGRGQPRLAAGHREGQPVSSFELDVTGMGAGDIWSTAHDVARWDAALAAGTILSDVAREAMLSVHTPVDDAAGAEPIVQVDGYGYGWFIGTAADRPVIFHPGGNEGFRAINAWFPADDVRLIALTNEEAADVVALVGELLAIAFADSV